MKKIFDIIKLEIQNDMVKYLVLLLVFTGQGILTAATTVFLPEILEINGIPSELLPEPSFSMAVAEGLENLILFGAITIILISMSIFASEIESGTIYYSLSRPVNRYEFVIGKISAKMLAITVITLISIIILWIYAGFVFGEIGQFSGIIDVIIPFLLLFLFLIALTSLFSTRLSTTSSGMASILSIAVFFTLPGILYDIAEISPFYLAGRFKELMERSIVITDELLAVFISITWIIVLTAGAVYSFQKRDI
ncbi:MAG: ABC transporter permease [Candidatus Hodarchaeales archaeon]